MNTKLHYYNQTIQTKRDEKNREYTSKTDQIVYKNRPVGPNDKEHCHLPDYVVVDFPNLKLPPDIPPWDKNHKTVRLLILFAFHTVPISSSISTSKRLQGKKSGFLQFRKKSDTLFSHPGFFPVWKISRFIYTHQDIAQHMCSMYPLQ